MPRPHDPALSQFIGCLTLAIGIGAMFNRAGGAYIVVADQRALWSIAITNTGCLILIGSILPMPRLRAFIMSIGIVLWSALAYRFYVSELYGALFQAATVVAFSLLCIWRLRLWWQDEQNAPA